MLISSDESLDDAVGDAAVRADPTDPRALADAIREAMQRRDELVPRGIAHAATFTWRGAGEVFLRAYEQALARL